MTGHWDSASEIWNLFGVLTNSALNLHTSGPDLYYGKFAKLMTVMLGGPSGGLSLSDIKNIPLMYASFLFEFL